MVAIGVLLEGILWRRLKGRGTKVIVLGLDVLTHMVMCCMTGDVGRDSLKMLRHIAEVMESLVVRMARCYAEAVWW